MIGEEASCGLLVVEMDADERATWDDRDEVGDDALDVCDLLFFAFFFFDC